MFSSGIHEASNDAELAAMLAIPVMNGLKIVGEMFLKPRTEQEINIHTNRGNQYHAGQGGSLSRAWTTTTSIGIGKNLGTMEFYFDNNRVSHIASIGQHVTPQWINDGHGGVYENYDFEEANNIAEIIDKGLGGMRLGPDNPTRTATHFWDFILNDFRHSERRWVTAGLRSAGLTVI